MGLVSFSLTQAQFELYLTTDGVVFYHLSVLNTISVLPLTQIKELIKRNSYRVQSYSDQLTRLRNYDLDERVGLGVFHLDTTSMPLFNLTNLNPETLYEICAYQETEFKLVTP